MKLELTKEIINERIKDRGIELFGEYINTRTHALFRCANNHTWESKLGSVLYGSGCPTCSGKLPLTKKM